MPYAFKNDAERQAIADQKRGMLSDDTRVVYQTPNGFYDYVVSGFEPSNAKVVSYVSKCKVTEA